MKVAVCIPIKLNNERLPGKNLLPLGNKLLCDFIFSTIQTVERIDARYVFCSDERIKEHIPEGIAFLKREAARPKRDDNDGNYPQLH